MGAETTVGNLRDRASLDEAVRGASTVISTVSVIRTAKEGDSFAFAKNNALLTEAQIQGAGKRIRPRDYRAQEFAGACFDPAGTTLFVNLQYPGITFAIWGPWERIGV